MTGTTSRLEDNRSSKKTSKDRGLVRLVLVRIAISVVLVGFLSASVLIVLAFHTTSPRGFRKDPSSIEQLAKEIREAHQAGPAGTPRLVHIDEAVVNSVFESQLSFIRNQRKSAKGGHVPDGVQAAANVRDFEVHLKDDRLQVHVTVESPEKDVTIDLEGKLRSKNGYMIFEPISGRIGALPLPRILLEQIVDTIMDSPEYRDSLRLPPGIHDLKVQDGEFVVAY